VKPVFPVLIAAQLAFIPASAAAPSVVASIKPVHSLVAAVMAGVAEPQLLVDGAASPHTYALSPSDADALENADIVFWTGEGLELFLAAPLVALAADAERVALSATPGLELLPVREGGAFDHDAHDHAHAHAHAHDDVDMHFWLDPRNAQLMIGTIAETLSAADPDNAAAYAANAQAAQVGLTTLEAEVAATLAPVADRPFIVFHDAYQYFEKRFGLQMAGSVTVTPDTMPGAARIDELRGVLQGAGASCVFAEPNFQPAIISAITEGTAARAGTLDPEGSTIEPGPELYLTLLRNLANDIAGCLIPAAVP
jgi:zinc transport system substrate-binding protein